MTKTYYLGFTQNGTVIGRASKEDYGFTFAGYIGGKKATTFSTTAEGVYQNLAWARTRPVVELVPVKVVTAKEYNAAMKKGA